MKLRSMLTHIVSFFLCALVSEAPIGIEHEKEQRFDFFWCVCDEELRRSHGQDRSRRCAKNLAKVTQCKGVRYDLRESLKCVIHVFVFL